MFPKISLCIAASLFLAALATGQEKVKVRFAAQALPPSMPEVVMASGEIISAPFGLSSENFTPAQEAPGRVFALRTQGTDKDFATVKLPGTGSRFIVLLVTDAERKARSVVIPDNRAAFKGGDVYAFNASAKPVLGQLGTRQFSLKPGAGNAVTPQGIVDGQYYEVRFATREGESSRMFSSARWPAGEKERCYVFFYGNPDHPDRVIYRVISEVLHPVENEGE